jgi:hypothetical protein
VVATTKINAAVYIVGEVSVEFDADVDTESLDKPQSVAGIEREGDFEDQVRGVQVGLILLGGGDGQRDPFIVDALLDFFIEKSVVGCERAEFGAPEALSLFHVSSVEPEFCLKFPEAAPDRVRVRGVGSLLNAVSNNLCQFA